MILPFNSHKKSLQYLKKLPKTAVSSQNVQFLYSAKEYHDELLTRIQQAQTRICLVALYLEHDEAGEEILTALYDAKRKNPQLDIAVLIDFHRAQRGRIGQQAEQTNAHFYYQMAQRYPDLDIGVYGAPINTREVFGVLHLKGAIIDNTVIYSGASINNVYLHVGERYRYDRYHIIHHAKFADDFYHFVNENFLTQSVVKRLNTQPDRFNAKSMRKEIRRFRHFLMRQQYPQNGQKNSETLSMIPFAGLGRKNDLNKLIKRLFQSTENTLTLCTPYFNLPLTLTRSISSLLKSGKRVEIIVADKTANDFYIPPSEPFKTIGGLPYFYEKTLRNFVRRFQRFIDAGLLTIRLWKDDENSFHLKGIWVDDNWMMITGNNLNPRAWQFDLENAILFYDPKSELQPQIEKEFEMIVKHTTTITHFSDLDALNDYPPEVQKLLRRLKRSRLDKLVKRLL